MNNTFDIKRFGLLLKRQWLEFGKVYLISLVVVFGVIAAFYLLNLWHFFTGLRVAQPHTLSFRDPLFLTCGFLFISVVASTYFAHLGQKARAAADLLVPASVTEKFLSSLFFTAILSTLSYFLIFYLTDLAFVTKLKNLFPQAFTKTETQAVWGGQKTVVVNDFFTYFFMQKGYNYKIINTSTLLITSIFLLGSVYFSRFHYVKTAISVMIFSGVWALIVLNSANALFRGRIRVEEQVETTPVMNGKDAAEWGVMALIVLFALIFWSITYVRLKEKEV